MAKARIVGIRNQLPEFAKTLHETGIAEVKEISPKDFRKESALDFFAEVSEELVKLEALKKYLPEMPVEKPRPEMSAAQALREAKKLGLSEKISGLREKKDALLSKKQDLFDTQKSVSVFSKFSIDFSKLFESSLASVLAARFLKKNYWLFTKELSEQKIIFEAADKELDKENVIALVAFEKTREAAVRAALEKTQGTIESLPQIVGTPLDAVAGIKKEIAVVEEQAQAIDSGLLALSKEHYADICFISEILEIESERALVSSKFARTEDLFVLEAFVPEKNFEKLSHMLSGKFGERVFVEKAPGHELHEELDEVPTLLDNPPQLGAFEFMTRFVSLPKSFDIDPTIVFALVFPIVYGMMLGDVGYGLLSIAFALVLMKISAPDGLLRPISAVWAVAAVPSILWGIFFDEYFGFSHVHLAEKFGLHIEPIYHGMERLHNIQEVLMLTIGLGFAIILLGFFLGFIREWREGNKSHAIGKLAWITLLVSGTALLGSVALGTDGVVGTAAIVGFLASLAVIVKAEGMIGLIEIPSVAGNILSFARILAVGLASVVVAATINDLVFPSLENGIVFFLISLPIFLFGHAFNTFLGMFEGLIQGARLNYVEFYSKFYSGGGREFSPFRVKRKFSKGR
ncbi:MAG: V-type ATP synthase subunit I [Candidatus Diapherotrites archaeon]|nr:V-type ATP synthase subunit I [Candidatus Diapherotrites archaeon]